MKKMYIVMMSLGILILTSCGRSNKTKSEETTIYKLDSKVTTLTWTGKYVADGHSHTGTVKISDGFISYKGDEFVSGNFKVDMKSIVDTDLESPKKDTLESHLNGMYFFKTNEYPEVKVTVNDISDKQIKATLLVLGKEIKAEIPIKVKKNDKTLNAKGKFEIDFASADVLSFKPAPGDPENAHIDTKIAFDLNLNLKK